MSAYLLLFIYSVVAFIFYQKALKVKHASKCPKDVEQKAYEIMQNSSHLMLSITSFFWLPSMLFYLLANFLETKPQEPQEPKEPKEPKDKGES